MAGDVSDRRIDHLVIAVEDLDAAGEFYAALGFLVGARNRHPWGTENRIVQFGSSFLELISVGEGAQIAPHGPGFFSFGAFVQGYLARREGLAMLVLDSADAAADAARFAAAGIGDFEPFFFERSGRRPDGSAVHVAFSLAFAADPALPEAGFFVCQQHFPEAFWNPDFQRHANGARDVAEVVLRAEAPGAHAGFVAAYAGAPVQEGAEKEGAVQEDAEKEGGAERAGPRVVALRGGGRIVLEAAGGAAPGFAGFSVRVGALEEVAARLRAAGIAHRAEAGALVVPPQAAFGLELRFIAGEG